LTWWRLADLVALGQPGGAWPTWWRLANLVALGQPGGAWPTWWRLANLVALGQPGGAWPTWWRLANLVALGRPGGAWPTWWRLANLVALGQPGGAWPTWWRLANLVALGHLQSRFLLACIASGCRPRGRPAPVASAAAVERISRCLLLCRSRAYNFRTLLLELVLLCPRMFWCWGCFSEFSAVSAASPPV
jgi:hypothetical protein